MSESRLRIETEDERERLHAARRDAEMCAACGRRLGADETIYLERFAVVRSYLFAPVGEECASHELLAWTAGAEPERCAGCGRGIHYRMNLSTRHRALCSKRCRVRTDRAKQRERAG